MGMGWTFDRLFRGCVTFFELVADLFLAHSRGRLRQCGERGEIIHDLPSALAGHRAESPCGFWQAEKDVSPLSPSWSFSLMPPGLYCPLQVLESTSIAHMHVGPYNQVSLTTFNYNLLMIMLGTRLHSRQSSISHLFHKQFQVLPSSSLFQEKALINPSHRSASASPLPLPLPLPSHPPSTSIGLLCISIRSFP